MSAFGFVKWELVWPPGVLSFYVQKDAEPESHQAIDVMLGRAAE